MSAKKQKVALGDWLAERNLDPSAFSLETWQMIHENLATLKEISSLTLDEIACRIYGASIHAKSRGNKRVAVSRAIVSRDIKQAEMIARICGFNPLLLFAPDLRRRVWQLINGLAENITVGNSIFRALRKCPRCGSENRSPTAICCSQCGVKL